MTSHPAFQSSSPSTISGLLANTKSANNNNNKNIQDSGVGPATVTINVGSSPTRPCTSSSDCRKSECCLSGSCSGSGHSGGLLDNCYTDVKENGGETPLADWTSTDSCPCQKGFHCLNVSPQSTTGFCMKRMGGGGGGGIFSLLGR